MTASAKRSFTALLERDGTALRWVVARVPFDVKKVWPESGRKVRGEIEGFAFRTTLFPHPHRGCMVLLVNRKMQAAAGVRVGAKAKIVLEPDLEERPAEIPPELKALIRGERDLQRWIERLSPSNRREIGKWIGEPKAAASRQRRAERMAERLMLAMEGEIEPPPVLRAIFQRQPCARAAWQALTQVERRNHLLGIFYYQTVDGRERRAERAVKAAIESAERREQGSAYRRQPDRP